MFRNLSPYGDTRPTTLPWASTLPRHWQIERAKTVMRTVDVRSAAGEEELLTVSSRRGVVPRASVKVSMFRAESYVGHKLCWPDDLVINSLWAWGRGLGVARHHGIVSTAYGVYRQRKADLDPSYLNELVRSEPFQWELQVRSQGVWKSRLQISDERWLDAPILVPPAEEQAAIVKYLAHANARIDKAIAAKRHLIDLLEEQRRSVASSVVTRGGGGLDLAPSGLEWLGGVPVDWDVAPLKRYWSVTDCKHLTVPFIDDGIPLASVSQAQRFSLDLSDAKRTDLESYELLIEGGRKPSMGDLIYCRNVGVGAATVVETDEAFAMGQDVCLLRSRDQNPYFMNHFLQSNAMRAQLEMILVGSTFRRINVEDVRALTIVVPPLAEQARLVALIDRQCAPLDFVRTKASREIALLQEFRRRLVADVVTGQVDVRAIAATLPDAPESVDNTVSATDDDLEEALSEGEE